MARDDGRLVVHFGKTYMWLVNEHGRLQLFALSTIVQTAKATADAMKTVLPGALQQPDAWPVKR